MTDDVYIRIMELVNASLEKEGVAPTKAVELSATVVSEVSSALGGRTVYLPRRAPWVTVKNRNRDIRDAYNGRNISDVCAKFGVSRSTVFRICKK